MDIPQIYEFETCYQANRFIKETFPQMTAQKIEVGKETIFVIGEVRSLMVEEIWRKYAEIVVLPHVTLS